jgi:hypothetical protein
MNDRPTPMTDEAILAADGQWTFLVRDLCRNLERQRDELLEQLTVIRTVASYPHHPNALHAINSIAKNSIAAVKGDHT